MSENGPREGTRDLKPKRVVPEADRVLVEAYRAWTEALRARHEAARRVRAIMAEREPEP